MHKMSRIQSTHVTKCVYLPRMPMPYDIIEVNICLKTIYKHGLCLIQLFILIVNCSLLAVLIIFHGENITI